MKRDPYFDKPGVSSHMLADFRNFGPHYYRRKHIEQVIADEDSDAYAFGRALHTLVLEGQAKFNAGYTEAPAEHLTPGGEVSTKKATKEWMAGQTGGVLSPGESFKLRRMAAAVKANASAAQLLMRGQPEVEKFAQHRSGLAIKGKVDWCDGTTGVDVKSCWNISEFREDAQKYGYVYQMAFYRALFGWTSVHLLAVEKNEPHRVRVYRLTEASLDAAHERNEAALDLLARHYESGEWEDPADIIDLDLAVA